MILNVIVITVNGQTKVAIDSIAYYKNQMVTVSDSVNQTKLDAKSGITFLDVGGHFPKQLLTIVIFKKDALNFPVRPEDLYRAKKISVTGRITEYKRNYRS